MLRFARWTRSCHTQVAKSKKRPAQKALVPQTFREVAEKALGLENPELSGDRVLANMTVEVERKRMQWASQPGRDVEQKRLLQSNDIDWDVGMTLVKKAEESFPIERVTEEKMESIATKTVSETLSKIAAHSQTLQSLVDLGVDISKWERAGLSSRVLTYDFDRDIAPVLRYLVDIGVWPRNLGDVATNAPMLFQHSVQDLEARVGYLTSKGFNKDRVAEIVRGAPNWLEFSVEEVDSKLGFFQKSFKLSGNEMRKLTCRLPSLIIWDGTPFQVSTNHIYLTKMMGFEERECKRMLMAHPELYMQKYEDQLQAVFDVLHNEAGFSHEMLAKFPEVLTARRTMECKQRLEFLRFLGRDQFDPRQPNYVSPTALACADEAEFCAASAKAAGAAFNEFLKTL